MRAVTGLVGRVNRDQYQVTTPTATVRIRGTGGVIQVRDDGSTLIVGTSGIWSLTNPAGSIDVPCGRFRARFNARLAAATYLAGAAGRAHAPLILPVAYMAGEQRDAERQPHDHHQGTLETCRATATTRADDDLGPRRGFYLRDHRRGRPGIRQGERCHEARSTPPASWCKPTSAARSAGSSPAGRTRTSGRRRCNPDPGGRWIGPVTLPATMARRTTPQYVVLGADCRPLSPTNGTTATYVCSGFSRHLYGWKHAAARNSVTGSTARSATFAPAQANITGALQARSTDPHLRVRTWSAARRRPISRLRHAHKRLRGGRVRHTGPERFAAGTTAERRPRLAP